jgi:hypothetical protein
MLQEDEMVGLFVRDKLVMLLMGESRLQLYFACIWKEKGHRRRKHSYLNLSKIVWGEIMYVNESP